MPHPLPELLGGPVLLPQALTSKAMRDRHWDEVMKVTGHDLNLAEDHFKLQHLLDCNILNHREEIEDLTNAAVKEEQIEGKLAVLQVCGQGLRGREGNAGFVRSVQGGST